jgi:hypothetical protein
MSTQEQMARLLRQWLQLTRAEAAAIRAGSWPKLQTIQSEKAQLREPLREARKAWRAQAGAARCSAEEEKPFRAAISRLVALEAQNAQLVTACQEKAHAQLLRLGRAARNLHRVKKSYAPEALVAGRLLV